MNNNPYKFFFLILILTLSFFAANAEESKDVITHKYHFYAGTFDHIDKDGTLGVEFGAYGVPETFLIDKNKKIIRKFVGPINKEIVEQIKLIIK